MTIVKTYASKPALLEHLKQWHPTIAHDHLSFMDLCRAHLTSHLAYQQKHEHAA